MSAAEASATRRRQAHERDGERGTQRRLSATRRRQAHERDGGHSAAASATRQRQARQRRTHDGGIVLVIMYIVSY